MEIGADLNVKIPSANSVNHCESLWYEILYRNAKLNATKWWQTFIPP